MPELSTPSARAEAVGELLDDVYAASTASAVRGRRKCYARILQLWGLTAHPISAQKVLFLGAGLKSGGYRSAGSVLSQYHVDAVRAGQVPDRQMMQLLSDASRSCRRGLGPPRRALALDVPKLVGLSCAPDPWLPSGPVGPRNLLMVSAWWLLREIEASAVRACHAVISDGMPPVATLTLTTSKTDPEARGVGRSHACICGRSTPRPDCPVHALWDQLLVLRQRFPEKHAENTPS